MAINSFPYTITENVLDENSKTSLDRWIVNLQNMPHKFSFSRIPDSTSPIVKLLTQTSTYLLQINGTTTINIKMEDFNNSCSVIQLLINNNSSFSFVPTILWNESITFNTKNLFWIELTTYNSGATWYGFIKGKYSYDDNFPKFDGYPADNLYPADDLYPQNN